MKYKQTPRVLFQHLLPLERSMVFLQNVLQNIMYNMLTHTIYCGTLHCVIDSLCVPHFEGKSVDLWAIGNRIAHVVRFERFISSIGAPRRPAADIVNFIGIFPSQKRE